MAQTGEIAKPGYSYFQNLSCQSYYITQAERPTQTPALSIDEHLHHLLVDLPSLLTLFLFDQSLGHFLRFFLAMTSLVQSLVQPLLIF